MKHVIGSSRLLTRSMPFFRDLPFLWKLRDEAEDAADEMLAVDGYSERKNYFSGRPNPKFSRIAYGIASVENKTITHMMEQLIVETGVNPVCLLFHGFIVEAETAETKETD